MRIRMLRNPSRRLAETLDCALPEGSEGDVKPEVGKKLIDLKLAEPATAKKAVKGEASKPNIAGGGASTGGNQ